MRFLPSKSRSTGSLLFIPIHEKGRGSGRSIFQKHHPLLLFPGRGTVKFVKTGRLVGTMVFQHHLSAFLLLNIILCLHLISGVSLNADGLSLLSLKYAVDGASVAAFSSWNEDDATPCRWTGITCMNISGSDDARVVGISVAGKSIRGYIPSELGSLIYLRLINFHGNDFYGSIPDRLFNASSLHSVFLHGNNLSGPVPSSACNPPRLLYLDLSNNSLSGPLPKFLRNCRRLQRLILSGNELSGEIPEGIFPELVNLEQLDLSANRLSGSIPGDMGELKSLSGTLNLSSNHFSGEIPKTLGDLSLTVSFDLRNNDLSGKIPQAGSFTSQGPRAFANNTNLCGFPLQRPCNNDNNNSGGSAPGIQGGGHSQNNMASGERKGLLKPGMIILICIADAAGVVLIGLVIIYVYWTRKDSDGCSSCINEKEGKLGGSVRDRLCALALPCNNGFPSDDSEADLEKGGSGEGGELVAIDKGFDIKLDELLTASAYVLGKSSSVGMVYKVLLGNGVPVAVRRLGGGGEQRRKEFVAEVMAIGKVKHPNVVKLRAYYWAPDEKLLITDFIPNGSLASALPLGGQPSSSSLLSWSTRLKIARGTARALAYLHECNPKKFVHGDIRPSNILLDNEFHPYISDLGLSRLITITGNDPASSSSGRGLTKLPPHHLETPNNYYYYRAPEARISGARPTQKCDVYSFGVILLELLTGKSAAEEASAATTSAAADEFRDIVGWVRKGERTTSQLVDPVLLQEVVVGGKEEEVAAAVLGIAMACTEGDPETRPKMKRVSDDLDKVVALGSAAAA